MQYVQRVQGATRCRLKIAGGWGWMELGWTVVGLTELGCAVSAKVKVSEGRV